MYQLKRNLPRVHGSQRRIFIFKMQIAKKQRVCIRLMAKHTILIKKADRRPDGRR